MRLNEISYNTGKKKLRHIFGSNTNIFVLDDVDRTKKKVSLQKKVCCCCCLIRESVFSTQKNVRWRNVLKTLRNENSMYCKIRKLKLGLSSPLWTANKTFCSFNLISCFRLLCCCSCYLVVCVLASCSAEYKRCLRKHAKHYISSQSALTSNDDLLKRVFHCSMLFRRGILSPQHTVTDLPWKVNFLQVLR